MIESRMSLYNLALKNFSSCAALVSENRVSGEISFIYENLLYLFSCENEGYFRLTLPNVLDVDEKTRVRLLLDIIGLNGKIKVAKATLVGGKLWISYESFVCSTENLDFQLMRARTVLRQYYKELTNLVRRSVYGE